MSIEMVHKDQPILAARFVLMSGPRHDVAWYPAIFTSVSSVTKDASTATEGMPASQQCGFRPVEGAINASGSGG
jgi:hypothetical protein